MGHPGSLPVWGFVADLEGSLPMWRFVADLEPSLADGAGKGRRPPFVVRVWACGGAWVCWVVRLLPG